MPTGGVPPGGCSTGGLPAGAFPTAGLLAGGFRTAASPTAGGDPASSDSKLGIIALYGPDPDLPPITLMHVGYRWYDPAAGRCW